MQRFHLWCQTIANITIICTLVLGLATIWMQQIQTRKETSFRMMAQLNEGALFEAQRRFLNEVIQLPLAELKGQIVDRDFMLVLFRQLLETSDNPARFVEDTMILASFYDEADACISSGSCDETVLRQRLGDRARRFACVAMPFVIDIREKYLLDGLGDGLARLADYENTC